MFDLGKQKVSIECPSCSRKHNVTIQQIATGVTVRCGCNTNIILEDKGGSAKSSIRNINNATRKLENTLRNFGK